MLDRYCSADTILTVSLHVGVSLDPEKNPKCVHCATIDLDTQLQVVFGVFCCPKCKAERPEMYSLLTKTECKEDYLLTDRKYKHGLSSKMAL
jgi:hypothetical protein